MKPKRPAMRERIEELEALNAELQRKLEELQIQLITERMMAHSFARERSWGRPN